MYSPQFIKKIRRKMKKVQKQCGYLAHRNHAQQELHDKLLKHFVSSSTGSGESGSQGSLTLGSGKIPKLPDFKRLELTGRADYEDWFLEFEDKLRQNAIYRCMRCHNLQL